MNNFFVTLEHVGESDWINFEDFTETLTGEIVEFQIHTPRSKNYFFPTHLNHYILLIINGF